MYQMRHGILPWLRSDRKTRVQGLKGKPVGFETNQSYIASQPRGNREPGGGKSLGSRSRASRNSAQAWTSHPGKFCRRRMRLWRATRRLRAPRLAIHRRQIRWTRKSPKRTGRGYRSLSRLGQRWRGTSLVGFCESRFLFPLFSLLFRVRSSWSKIRNALDFPHIDDSSVWLYKVPRYCCHQLLPIARVGLCPHSPPADQKAAIISLGPRTARSPTTCPARSTRIVYV